MLCYSQGMIVAGDNLSEFDQWLLLYLDFLVICILEQPIRMYLGMRRPEDRVFFAHIQAQLAVLVLSKRVHVSILGEAECVKRAAGHAHDFFVRQVVDELRTVLLELEAGAETPVRSVAPQVHFAGLGDRRAMALACADLAHSPLGQFHDLCRDEHIVL